MVTPEQRLTDLRAKLAAREGRPGMTANVAAIKAEIQRLEQEIADGV